MKHAIFSILMLALLVFAACGNKDAGGGTGGGGIQKIDASTRVRVITADRCATLDPHVTSSGGDAKVIDQVYETLLRVDPKNPDEVMPALAESFSIEKDGKLISFKIREGVKFHDGTPLDARAVKLSLDRLWGNEFKLPKAPYRGEFDFVLDTRAEGMNLMVALKRPIPRIALKNLTMFSASIVSPRLLQEAHQGRDENAASAYVSANASGTGPFKLTSLDTNSSTVTLAANDSYHGGAPAVKTLIFRQVGDPVLRHQLLTKGEAEVVDDLPRNLWADIKGRKDFTLHAWWGLNTCYLGLNSKHAKTREPALRRAIQLAVDRNAIIEMFDGTSRASFNLLSHTFPTYNPNIRVEGWVDDLSKRQEAARALVKEAGAEGRELTIYHPTLARPYLPDPSGIADKLRQQLNAIGLKVSIKGVENSEFFGKTSQDDAYELILIGWMSDNADPDNYYNPLAGGDMEKGIAGESNVSRAFDAEIQGMINEAQGIKDKAERDAKYHAIEQLLQNRVRGYVPLVNSQQAVAFSNRVSGIEVDPLGHYRLSKAVLK